MDNCAKRRVTSDISRFVSIAYKKSEVVPCIKTPKTQYRSDNGLHGIENGRLGGAVVVVVGEAFQIV